MGKSKDVLQEKIKELERSDAYSPIVEKHVNAVASKLWNLEIPKVKQNSFSEGEEFGREVVQYLRSLGFYCKGKYETKEKR